MDTEGRHWLQGAALWTVVGVGFLGLTGYLRVKARLGNHGLPWSEVSFPPEAYLQASFESILLPSVLFSVFILFSWTPWRKESPQEWALSLPAVALMTALMLFALRSVMRLGGPTTEDQSAWLLLLQWFSTVVAPALVTFVVAATQLGGSVREHWEHPRFVIRFFGRDRRSVAFLSLAAAFCWITATLTGAVNEAVDERWQCNDWTGVSFVEAPPGLEPNVTYQHIEHEGGWWYLRDPRLEPWVRDLVVVFDGATSVALFTAEPASRLC